MPKPPKIIKLSEHDNRSLNVSPKQMLEEALKLLEKDDPENAMIRGFIYLEDETGHGYRYHFAGSRSNIEHMGIVATAFVSIDEALRS